MSKQLKINISIPAYNRATLLPRAIESSLSQTYDNFTVTVIDDGSRDGTWEVCKKYENVPNFSAIRLSDNQGTATAKNVGLYYSKFDAITFHDSDDVFAPNKLALQSEPMLNERPRSDEILNWSVAGRTPNELMDIDVVVGSHRLIKMDGQIHEINKRISLVDDFFPQTQFPSKTEGDWCLVNSGLFHRRVFRTMGGFLDSVEEDRELRNRALSFGMLVYFVNEPLLDKFEQPDSLTVTNSTGYKSLRRKHDREVVWSRAKVGLSMMLGLTDGDTLVTPIDLKPGLVVDTINPNNLSVNEDIPHSKNKGYAVAAASKKSPIKSPPVPLQLVQMRPH